MGILLGALKVAGKGIGGQLIKQAPKYGAKVLLGTGAEVAIFLASNAIINQIKEPQMIVDGTISSEEEIEEFDKISALIEKYSN